MWEYKNLPITDPIGVFMARLNKDYSDWELIMIYNDHAILKRKKISDAW